MLLFVYCCGDHRDPHVLTHSCPARRSSDLYGNAVAAAADGSCTPRLACLAAAGIPRLVGRRTAQPAAAALAWLVWRWRGLAPAATCRYAVELAPQRQRCRAGELGRWRGGTGRWRACPTGHARSEEHTSELQSLMRISYAVFCLKKKKKENTQQVSK